MWDEFLEKDLRTEKKNYNNILRKIIIKKFNENNWKIMYEILILAILNSKLS